MTSQGFIGHKLRPLISAVASTAFLRGYQASEEAALGVIVAHYFQWDGVRILAVFEKALDDANLYAEANKVRDMIADIAAEDV